MSLIRVEKPAEYAWENSKVSGLAGQGVSVTRPGRAQRDWEFSHVAQAPGIDWLTKTQTQQLPGGILAAASRIPPTPVSSQLVLGPLAWLEHREPHWGGDRDRPGEPGPRTS